MEAPGFSGGNEWGGMTFDPRLEYLFVNTENVMWTTAVVDRKGRANGIGQPGLSGHTVPLHLYAATTNSRTRTAIPPPPRPGAI